MRGVQYYAYFKQKKNCCCAVTDFIDFIHAAM